MPSQGLSGISECNCCISPDIGGLDVRWVRFPKHIPLFSTNLSKLESVSIIAERFLPHHPDSEGVQRISRGDNCVICIEKYVRSPGRLGSHRE